MSTAKPFWVPWPTHPPASGQGGFVYVLLFEMSGGLKIVKVGRTQVPRRRVSSHALYAERFGGRLVQGWLSVPHITWERTEKALIANALCMAGEPLAGSEYFTGVSYEALVEVATSLSKNLAASARERPTASTRPRLSRHYARATLQPQGRDFVTDVVDAYEAGQFLSGTEWRALCLGDFAPRATRLGDRAQRREVAAALRAEGLSLRAIAAPLGISAASVVVLLDEIEENSAPSIVRGTGGRRHKPDMTNAANPPSRWRLRLLTETETA